MNQPRVYIDFHAEFGPDLYSLGCRGTIDDLRRYEIEATEGTSLSVYSDDIDKNGRTDNLIAEGVVRNDPKLGLVLYIDPATVRHESDEKNTNS